MTEEIINTDGSRNWQADILLDNIKRLEQENKELKEATEGLLKVQYALADCCKKYHSTLEEIRGIAETELKPLVNSCGRGLEYVEQILQKISEVLE